MSSKKILIVGAGVAGSVLAYWLGKDGFQVTVIERSGVEQKFGQGLEIEEPALTVVKAMGILDKLNARKTGELGFELVNQHGASCGRILQQAGGFSPTGALEIMRGNLCDVLYQAADSFDNVTYRYETTIQSLNQTPTSVTVGLANKTDKTVTSEEFDIVVAADGVGSRTREMAMGSTKDLDCLKPVGATVAYFSIPTEAGDWPLSQACQYGDNRLLWIRPVGEKSDVTSVYLLYCKDGNAKLHEAHASGDRLRQKEALAEVFGGLTWQAPRVIRDMMKADNFYMDELTQIKISKWSQDRVVLVGDSAWAPTPFTGQGNQLAIIGAWVLAQEMSRNPTTAAFETYERRFRTYVEESQQIPLGGKGPRIFNPQSAWGVLLFRTIFRIASLILQFLAWSKLTRLFPEQKFDPNFDLEMETPDVKSSS